MPRARWQVQHTAIEMRLKQIPRKTGFPGEYSRQYLLIKRLDDIFRHFLGVAQQHHRAILIEQRIVDTGIS